MPCLKCLSIDTKNLYGYYRDKNNIYTNLCTLCAKDRILEGLDCVCPKFTYNKQLSDTNICEYCHQECIIIYIE